MLVLIPRRPLSHSLELHDKLSEKKNIIGVCAKRQALSNTDSIGIAKQIKIYHYQLQIRLFEFSIRRRTRTSHNSDVATINL